MRLQAALLVPGLVVASSFLLNSISGIPANPPVDDSRMIESHMEIPADVHRILQRSCYDCHSTQTRWPWYSRVPGVSGLLQSDVKRARLHLNLSDWSTKLAEGQDEAQASLNGICEELRTDSMPISKYRWLHRNAVLSPAEVEIVCRWTTVAKAR